MESIFVKVARSSPSTSLTPIVNNYDALRDLVPFVKFKKVKNTHGGVLILVKLQASVFLKKNGYPLSTIKKN